MVRRWSRREFLHAGAVASAVCLAGCQVGAQPETPTHTEPVGDGSASPAPNCPHGYRSIEPWWVVVGPGPLGGFELDLDQQSYERGEKLVAELRNVTDTERLSGAQTKYDIQFKAAHGWQTVIGVPEDGHYPWPAIGIAHQPGEGFTWQINLTQEGISGDSDPAESYRACGPMAPGTYRFIYWGITSEREREEDFETDYALGVPFTLQA